MFNDDFMAMRFSVGFAVSLIAISFILCYNRHIEEVRQMGLGMSILTVAITVLVTEGINLIIYFVKRRVEKKDIVTKIDEKIDRLTPDISKDISSKIGVNNGGRSIADQIGVKSGEALASRIDKIGISVDDIGKNINSSNTDCVNRLKKLSKHQKEIRDKISDISDVIDDWQRLVNENEKLTEENRILRLEIEQLEDCSLNDDSDFQHS